MLAGVGWALIIFCFWALLRDSQNELNKNGSFVKNISKQLNLEKTFELVFIKSYLQTKPIKNILS